MAFIMRQMPEHDITCCMDTNPELILMRMQGDEAEAEIEESQWLSGTYATPPKSSNTTKE